MDAIPTLKVVAKHGMGVDNIDVAHATEKGILVVNAPYSNMNAVAEHIVTLLLALSKRIVRMDKLTRNGGFAQRNTYKTMELKNATVGIVGMGEDLPTGGKEALCLRHAYHCQRSVCQAGECRRSAGADDFCGGSLQHLRIS